MKLPDINRLYIGPRLTLCFAVIISLMLAGDGFLLWQLNIARVQTARMTGISEELIAVVRLQGTLLSFDDNLDSLAQSQDVGQLSRNAGPLRAVLLQGTRETRDTLAHLPPGVHADPSFLPTIGAIESALPSQLEAITALAASGDWTAVRLRLANEKKPLEYQVSSLVKNINQEVSEEHAHALMNINRVQQRMLLILPATAIFTLLTAVLLGLAITRSITEPLRRLVEGSRALAKGDFEHQVAISGQDEIAQVGQVFNDTADRLRSLYETLQNREAHLAEAQRLTHMGSWVWRIEGRTCLHLSEEWYRVWGFDRKEGLPGWEKRLQRVHPADRAMWEDTIERAIREKSDYDVEFRILLPNGAVKWLHTVGHPILDTAGDLLQFLGTSTDITERKQAEDELRRSEAYLAEAQKLTRSGSWAWNLRTGAIFWSRELFRIYDYDPEKITPSWPHIFKRVHPEDRSGLEQRAKIETTQKGTVDSEGDFRIILPDGSTRHLHSIAHPVVDGSGEIAEVVGTVMDVTDQHEARAALETAFAEIKTLKDQLFKENIALREEIDKASMFEEIVGESPALQAVLARVARVAPTDSTVLITGETGTGKELIARAVHKRSQRASRAFVSVNCAAIPATLIASELFGHEKGAFTGALHRRLGRFELAEGGTIFLDEIGELPAETQIALLRVLQEREFERIGGSQPIRADVRVITATNRDLQGAIAAGSFRRDLFYRLNVFPIEIPALRDRKEDIRTLVVYFIHRYSRKSGKKIGTIEKKTLELLESYAWPGNIRELQNVIERSVIVCESDVFSVDPSWLSLESCSASSLQEAFPTVGRSTAPEKDAIEMALAASRGRVSGPSGAAAQLNMPASTLESRIRSLKINKYRFKDI